MRTLTRDSGVVARIWLDDLPAVTYPPFNTIERRLETHRLVLGTARSIAVEVAGMVGHPSSYGLLGASFTPLPVDQLLIQVVCSTENGCLLDWALAGRCDEVHAGLPAEYASSVLDAAGTADGVADLSAGLLRFDHAAHGDVGSSSWFFGQLGRLLVSLLPRDVSQIRDDELAEIIAVGLRR